MKSVPCVRYETKQETCYRTVYDCVTENKTVTTTHHVPETHHRTLNYVVNHPVYDRHSRVINYTVWHREYDLRTQEIPYTVWRTEYEPRSYVRNYTVWRREYDTRTRLVHYTTWRTEYETRSRDIHYTTYRPEYETRTRMVNYTTYRPEYTTHQRQVPYTTYKTVTETRTRTVPYSVCKPVHYTKTIEEDCGHWEKQIIEKPGPVVTRCVQEPGCWEWDPCCCRCVYKPGPCKEIQVQCPPVKCCKCVWVPEIRQREVTCVRYEYETKYKQVPETFCRSVPETHYRTETYSNCHYVPEYHQRAVNYTVCRMIPEPQVRTNYYTVAHRIPEPQTREVSYQVCRMVPEPRSQVVNYNVARRIPEQRFRTVSYKVWRSIPEQRSRTVYYTTCRMVPEHRTRTVTYTTYRTEHRQHVVKCTRQVPRQEPYTVTRCVPVVHYKQCPVKVCCPVPCDCASAPPAGDSMVLSPTPESRELNVPAIEDPTAIPPTKPEGDAQVQTVRRQAQPVAEQRQAEPEEQNFATLYTAAMQNLSLGRYADAEKAFEVARKLNPNDARLLYFQAVAQWAQGHEDQAQDTVAIAVQREQQHPIANWGISMERLQGRPRVWLEGARREAMENAAKNQPAADTTAAR